MMESSPRTLVCSEASALHQCQASNYGAVVVACLKFLVMVNRLKVWVLLVSLPLSLSLSLSLVASFNYHRNSMMKSYEISTCLENYKRHVPHAKSYNYIIAQYKRTRNLFIFRSHKLFISLSWRYISFRHMHIRIQKLLYV